MLTQGRFLTYQVFDNIPNGQTHVREILKDTLPSIIEQNKENQRNNIQ